jgi:predicted ATP-binding protein involved in virulence
MLYHLVIASDSLHIPLQSSPQYKSLMEEENLHYSPNWENEVLKGVRSGYISLHAVQFHSLSSHANDRLRWKLLFS